MEYIPVEDPGTFAENHEPRFRLFVYGGLASERSPYDLIGASVEEALEGGYMSSDRNRYLWSLALVTALGSHESSRSGLTWVSGTDYSRRPSTLAAWRLRGQMQDRYLSAKVDRGEEPRLPNGLRVIRMSPEWGVELPLWESFTDSYLIEPGALPIGPELESELEAWNLEWQSYGLDAERPPSWVEQSWPLHARVQAALDGIAEVRPEFG